MFWFKENQRKKNIATCLFNSLLWHWYLSIFNYSFIIYDILINVSDILHMIVWLSYLSLHLCCQIWKMDGLWITSFLFPFFNFWIIFFIFIRTIENSMIRGMIHNTIWSIDLDDLRYNFNFQNNASKKYAQFGSTSSS